MHRNDDFTVLVSGGGRCCWVSMCTVRLMNSKWLSEWSNESAPNFALSLNIPPKKLFGWFRRLQLWATGDCQLQHNHLSAHASYLMQRFLVKHQITQVTQPRVQPRYGALWLLGFPKTKISFKREEISDCQWESGKYTGQLMVIGRTVWGPKVPTLKGTEVSLSYIQCFLYLTSLSINVPIFHITWLDTFRQTSYKTLCFKNSFSR